MTFKISRIKAKNDQKLILEAKEGTLIDNTLTIAKPKWGTENDFSISRQITARIDVKVDGVPLSAIGLRVAKGAPKFPRMMRLNRQVGEGIELIDK